jgi:hypothetical protein
VTNEPSFSGSMSICTLSLKEALLYPLKACWKPKVPRMVPAGRL